MDETFFQGQEPPQPELRCGVGVSQVRAPGSKRPRCPRAGSAGRDPGPLSCGSAQGLKVKGGLSPRLGGWPSTAEETRGLPGAYQPPVPKPP